MTEIILHAEPGVVLSWEEFKAKTPPYSIALDGYVSGLTRYCSTGPYANFNHHEDVNRLATRSTCMQIYFSIVLGLFESFQKEGKRFAHVYVNDADQDVCLSYWLLSNPDIAATLSWDHPLSKFLVFEDFVDASAGAYPFDDSQQPDSLLRKQAWVFEPYTSARREQQLHSMSGHEVTQLIETISARITLFAENRAESIAIDTQPEIIGGGSGWKMIVDHGGYARAALYASGISACAGVRKRNDGNFTYVLGKMSPYVAFPLLDIYEALNMAEGCTTRQNCWGGSDIIGGSPRRTGSSLSPEEVERIINTVIQADEYNTEL